MHANVETLMSHSERTCRLPACIFESCLSMCMRKTQQPLNVWRRNCACRPLSGVRRTWAGSNVDLGRYFEENCTLLTVFQP